MEIMDSLYTKDRTRMAWVFVHTPPLYSAASLGEKRSAKARARSTASTSGEASGALASTASRLSTASDVVVAFLTSFGEYFSAKIRALSMASSSGERDDSCLFARALRRETDEATGTAGDDTSRSLGEYFWAKASARSVARASGEEACLGTRSEASRRAFETLDAQDAATRAERMRRARERDDCMELEDYVRRLVDNCLGVRNQFRVPT